MTATAQRQRRRPRRQRRRWLGQVPGSVFGNDAVKNKRNTDAVGSGPNQPASGRIVNTSRRARCPLAEVKDKVRERVVAEQASARRARKAPAPGRAAEVARPRRCRPPLTVSRMQPQGLPREAVDAVLKADAGQLPVVLGRRHRRTGLPGARSPGAGARPARRRRAAAAKVSIRRPGRGRSQAYLASLKAALKAEVALGARSRLGRLRHGPERTAIIRSRFPLVRWL